MYKLCEDISFGPNGPEPGSVPGEDAFDPVFDKEYRTNEFGLGFFSALCIASSDVTLYLNHFKIEQTAGHALMQRFFSVIELASSPFIADAGPAQFIGEDISFAPATNVNILGPGLIGRSAHHGMSTFVCSSCHLSLLSVFCAILQILFYPHSLPSSLQRHPWK